MAKKSDSTKAVPKQFMVRMPEELHKRASKAAGKAGLSLNGYVVEAIEGKLGPVSGQGVPSPVPNSDVEWLKEKAAAEDGAMLGVGGLVTDLENLQKKSDKIFTPEQVESLNAYQNSGVMHPFTCADDPQAISLVATEDGWVCPTPGCEYKQNWAHPHMFDWSWKNSPLMKMYGPPKSAADLAARFGIKTGATIEEVEPRLLAGDSNFTVPEVRESPAQEHMPSRNWQKFYDEIGEMEPAEAMHEFKTATGDITLPVGFLKMPRGRQISWLMENA